MREKLVVLSALLFSGTLALNVATVWSQGMPGDPARPGGVQTQPERGDKQPGQAGTWSSDDIKKVQQALKEKGHDPGAVDGVMSSKTQQAIRAFQQKNGLQATGALNAETAAALGVSSSGSGGKSSPGEREPGAGGRTSPGESGAGGRPSPQPPQSTPGPSGK